MVCFGLSGGQTPRSRAALRMSRLTRALWDRLPSAAGAAGVAGAGAVAPTARKLDESVVEEETARLAG